MLFCAVSDLGLRLIIKGLLVRCVLKTPSVAIPLCLVLAGLRKGYKDDSINYKASVIIKLNKFVKLSKILL